MTLRGFSSLAYTLALVGAMVAALSGGCFKPEDTFVNYANANGSGSGGGEGGSLVADTPREFFELEVKEDMVINCGKSGCHNSGDVGFLTVGLEYETITTWNTKEVAPGSPLLIPNPAKSLLITYPSSLDHTGVNWEENGLEDLRERVLEWLEMEAENLDPNAFLEIGPVQPKGLMVLPLDTLSPDLAGFSLSFYATEHGHPTSLLELTQISMWPPNGRGLRVSNVTFVIQAPINVAPVLDKSFHGDPQVFVAPAAVKVGPGELVLTEWGENFSLSVRFESLEPLFADDEGNTYTPCTRVDLFVQGVEDLPIQSGATAANGLLYCADQCHGGTKGSAPTDVMDMTELLIDPRDYPFVCAKVKQFITPSNVDGSAIITSTNPVGMATHLFAFGGQPSAHNAFKAAMTPWIEQEGLMEE